MKICVLTHTFPRNNQDVAAAFMKPFCDGLVVSGNEVTVITPYDIEFNRNGDPFKIETYKYIWPKKFHILGYSKTMEADVALRKRAYLLLPTMLIFQTLKLLRFVYREKPDLINVHWIIPNGLPAMVVSKLTGVPYIVTIPGTDAYLAYRSKIFGFLAKIIANNSSGLVSNSSFNLKRIISLGIKNKLSAVISYPADVSAFRPLSKGLEKYRKKLGILNNEFVILAVGRLVYKKGFEYLIKAVTLLNKKKHKYKLLIGGEGDLKEDLVNLSNKLRIKDKVIFLGNIPREEIIYYYNFSDVLVAPSIIDSKGNVDGGPVVTLESMACGKPQILTEVLGMADFIENGKNGFVVPEKNEFGLAAVLSKLYLSKNLRVKMGRLNREIAMSNLTIEKIGKKYTDFFRRAVNDE